MPLEPTAEFKRRRVKFLSGLVCTYINMDFEPIPAARTHRNDLEPSQQPSAQYTEVLREGKPNSSETRNFPGLGSGVGDGLDAGQLC